MSFRCPAPFTLVCSVVLGGALASTASTAAMPAAATRMSMVEWPALSPDGRTLVFEWLDALWSASVEGGEAVRLTDPPAHDTRPQFTPDGRRVVFSSNRSGAFQVFSMAASGGAAVQHSFHSEGGLLECLAPDGNHAIVSATREQTGPNATRLLEVDLTGDRRERCVMDAYANSAACSPDGRRILFCRGGDRPLRQGEAGTRASQLWLYQKAGKSFERLLPAASDVRSPLWHPDGKGFYYVSSKNGVANLCSYSEATQTSQQLTFCRAEGVAQPSVAADGATFILFVGWRLCRFRPASDTAPVPLELWTRAAVAEVSRVIEPVDAATDADFSPDLQQVVFAAHGALWWMEHGRNPPLRLTETPGADSEVRFSRDGAWLYFLRDDGLEANYWRAAFAAGRLGDAQPVSRGPRTKCRLKPSPDGSQIAWVEGTGDVYTAAADGSKSKRVFQSWDRPTLDWSPCGRWLALAASDKHSNRDIWLAAADGSRPPLDLTRNPAFEGSPRWSPDGRFLVFTARRDRSGTSGLWRIDFGTHGLAPDLPDVAILRCGELAVPLATRGIAPSRVIWAADSKSLLLQNDDPGDPRLYSLTSSGKSLSVAAKHRGVPIRATADGSLLWLVDGCPAILKQGELTGWPIATTVERKREDVLRLGFRRIWRTLGERFYDPAMKGADWPALREKYEPLAIAARDSRQFERIVALLLGELNASHLGFAGEVWPVPIAAVPRVEATGHPGLVFCDEPGPGPLVIARVLAGSPVGQLKEAPRPGEIVTRIAGQDVDTCTPLHALFAGAAGRSIPLMVRAADGRERVLELRCISYAEAHSLELAARETAYRGLADTPPQPRIAYLPWSHMEPEDIQQLELQLYRASLDHDGLILDVRNNGGGNAADQVLALFSQPTHVFTLPRDGPPGYPVERRNHPVWDQPVVVLCNENTCSNAEIFCHAMQRSGRAPLVGSTTAACVISAVEETIPDLGWLQVPFRGWFDATTGDDLDRLGVVPDEAVALGPADEVAGHDPQFQRALEVVRACIAKAPGPVAPQWRR